MSNKKEPVSHETVSYVEKTESRSSSAWAIVGLFVLGGIMIRSGFELGAKVADKVLRRHDKDVKLLEKKAKREAKEKLKQEKREAKEKLKQERKASKVCCGTGVSTFYWS